MYLKFDAILKKELSSIKEPERAYSIYRTIWLPKHWRVTRSEPGKETQEIHPVIMESEFYETPVNTGEGSNLILVK